MLAIWSASSTCWGTAFPSTTIAARPISVIPWEGIAAEDAVGAVTKERRRILLECTTAAATETVVYINTRKTIKALNTEILGDCDLFRRTTLLIHTGTGYE